MIELKLKEVHVCLERVGQLNRLRDKEYAGALDAKHKEIEVLEKDKRLLNERVNDLIVDKSKHEQENTRVLFAGLVFGVIVGAVGAILWMG